MHGATNSDHYPNLGTDNARGPGFVLVVTRTFCHKGSKDLERGCLGARTSEDARSKEMKATTLDYRQRPEPTVGWVFDADAQFQSACQTYKPIY